MAKKRTTRRRRSTKADREFISEAEEILERMRDDLADLNDQRGGSAEVDPELVNRIFRSAHSLKALAGMFGFDPITSSPTASKTSSTVCGSAASPSHFPAVSLIDERWTSSESLLQRVGDAEALAEAGDQSRTSPTASKPRAGSRSASGRRVRQHWISIRRCCAPSPSTKNIACARTSSAVGTSCSSNRRSRSFPSKKGSRSSAPRFERSREVLSTLPAPGETPESQIRFSLLSATDLSLERAHVAPRLSERQRAFRADGSAHGRLLPRSRCPTPESVAAAEELVEASLRSRFHRTPPRRISENLRSLKSISDTVRVDIRKLDELMNLVGELVIQRGALGDIVRRMLADPQTARIGNDLSKVYKDARSQSSRAFRPRCWTSGWCRCARSSRRSRVCCAGSAASSTRTFGWIIRGADTELDKLIVEELVDPLMHTVRNALDHAIEIRRKSASPPARIPRDAFASRRSSAGTTSSSPSPTTAGASTR